MDVELRDVTDGLWLWRWRVIEDLRILGVRTNPEARRHFEIGLAWHWIVSHLEELGTTLIGRIPGVGDLSFGVRATHPDKVYDRQPHPDWREGFDWEPAVASFAVQSRGTAILLDPLAPPPGARDVWARLEALRPQAVVVLKPDHVRDVDLFVRWYGARALGPFLFWRDDVPRTELEPVRPGDELPGGLRAVDDGRGQMETPVFLPEQRALVFADGLTAPGGVLRVWGTAWHEERTLPALRALLELPFEHVLVAHGEPVHTREDFVAALDREPWSS